MLNRMIIKMININKIIQISNKLVNKDINNMNKVNMKKNNIIKRMKMENSMKNKINKNIMKNNLNKFRNKYLIMLHFLSKKIGEDITQERFLDFILKCLKKERLKEVRKMKINRIIPHNSYNKCKCNNSNI